MNSLKQFIKIIPRWGCLIILGLLCKAQLQAQEVLVSSSRTPKPTWVGKPQTAVDEYYFYGIGQANNLIEAKEMAAKDVIIDIFKKQKCTISLDEINKTTQKQKGETFEIEGQYYSIMHTKCKDISTEGYDLKDFYWEQWKRENGEIFYRYYLWVSLPKPPLKSKNTAMLWSIFPGGGQIYKREYGKPILIWAGLGISAVSTFHLSNRAVYWSDVAQGFPSNKTERNRYERYQRTNTIGAIGCGVAAAGLYIWNLYDAHHHENKRIRFTKAHFKLQPYYAVNHGGLMLSYSLHPQK